MDTRFYNVLGPVALGDLVAGLDIQPLEPKFQETEITYGAALSASSSGHISFLQSKKYKADIETAQATACFISEDLAHLAGYAHIIPLISQYPRAHFGRVLNRLVRKKDMHDVGELAVSGHAPRIHPTAVIAKTAEIGEGTTIAPFVVIGPGVKIGKNCHIGAHVILECTIMGDSCIVKPGSCIGTRGFGVDGDELGILDLPHVGRVIIGDNVSIGAKTTIDRGFVADTILGDNVKIDNLVQIGHNVIIDEGAMIAAQSGLSGSCHIGKNVMMGGAVGLADHIRIGDGAKIAARACLMHDVPAGEVWSGFPAMPIRDHMRTIAATKKLIQKKS